MSWMYLIPPNCRLYKPAKMVSSILWVFSHNKTKWAWGSDSDKMESDMPHPVSVTQRHCKCRLGCVQQLSDASEKQPGAGGVRKKTRIQSPTREVVSSRQPGAQKWAATHRQREMPSPPGEGNLFSGPRRWDTPTPVDLFLSMCPLSTWHQKRFQSQKHVNSVRKASAFWLVDKM